jgi:hypothetical protein
MSIRVTDLEKNERETSFTVEEEVVHISYRPSAYTPVVEDRMQQLLETNRPGNGLAKTLSTMLIKWDVLGEDNQPVPITVENLSALPVRFLSQVMGAINKDNSSDQETRKNSGGGSFQKGT